MLIFRNTVQKTKLAALKSNVRPYCHSSEMVALRDIRKFMKSMELLIHALSGILSQANAIEAYRIIQWTRCIYGLNQTTGLHRNLSASLSFSKI